MKYTLIFFCVLLFYKNTHAQIDSSEYKDLSLYLYKTEADFFSKKNSYRGQYLPASDAKIIHYTTKDSKKRKLNLEDSCNFYYGYQIGDEIKIRPGKTYGDYVYFDFGGVNMTTYCVALGSLPNYDKQGYLLGLTSPGGGMYMYFVDKKTNKIMVQMDELLSSKPTLLDAYIKERVKFNYSEWQRTKLRINIKYLKLYITETAAK
jgi:hypothetical protein